MNYFITLTFLCLTYVASGFQSSSEIADRELVRKLNDEAFKMLSQDRAKADSISERGAMLNEGRFPKEQVRSFLLRGMIMKYQNKSDSALQLLNTALVKSKALKMPREEGLANWYLGKIWCKYKDYDQAKPYYIKSIKILEEIEDYEVMFKVLNGIGFIEKSQGNLVEALTHFNKALEVVYKGDLEDHANKLLKNIGDIYFELKDFDKALEYNTNSLNIKDSLTNKGLLTEALVQRAKIFTALNMKDSVDVAYQNAFKYLHRYELDDGFLNYHLGLYHHNEQDFEKSVKYLRKFVSDSGNVANRGSAYIYLSNNYSILENYEEAIKYSLSAYELGVELNSLKIKCESTSQLASLYAQEGKYQLANQYLLEYNNCNNLILKSALTVEAATLRTELESHEKRKEIAHLQSVIDSANFKRILIIKLTSMTILILVTLIFLVVRKHMKKSQLFEIKEMDLKNQYDESKKQLHTQTMHLIRVNNNVTEIEEKLRELKPKINGHSLELQRLINTIKLKKSEEKDWDNFDRYFNNSQSDFINILKQRFPTLTLNELRLCSLIRENMTNSEIASILNVEKRSVAMAKYRAKKKCGIPEEEDFTKVICELDTPGSFKTAS